MILSLPYDIKIHILKKIIPNNDCNIFEFLNLRCVNKEFKKLIDDIEIWIDYSKKLNIYKLLQFNFKKLYKHNENQLETKEKHSILKNLIFDKNEILNFHSYIDIELKYSYLIEKNIISYNILKTLPVCKLKSSKCIDNLCSYDCYLNNHNLNKYGTNRLMRGIDDKNRPYLLFIYKVNNSKENIYEIIYLEKKYKSMRAFSSGIYNKKFIGSLSNYRENNKLYYTNNLTIDSFLYMKKLINNEDCGIVKYDHYEDYYYECYSDYISIY